jgi:hypothetical protein
MASKKGDIVITGTQGGISSYISHGLNIHRACSPLTSARVKEDPAFAGLRKSSNRMKEASPIAASLYNQIPKEKKEFNLYRLLTGEAIKMIRAGIEKAIIRQTLHDKYIVPVLETMAIAEVSSERSSGSNIHSSKHEVNALIDQPLISIQSSKEKISSSTSNLIFIGRAKGYRKLKIWLRTGN